MGALNYKYVEKHYKNADVKRHCFLWNITGRFNELFEFRDSKNKW